MGKPVQQMVDNLAISNVTWRHVGSEPPDVEVVEIIDAGETIRKNAGKELGMMLPDRVSEIIVHLGDTRTPTIPKYPGLDTVYPGGMASLYQHGPSTILGKSVGQQIAEVLIAQGVTIREPVHAVLPSLSGRSRTWALFVLVCLDELTMLEEFIGGLVTPENKFSETEILAIMDNLVSSRKITPEQLAPAYARASYAIGFRGPAANQLYLEYLERSERSIRFATQKEPYSEQKIQDVGSVLRAALHTITYDKRHNLLMFMNYTLDREVANRVLSMPDMGESLEAVVAKAIAGVKISTEVQQRTIDRLYQDQLESEAGLYLGYIGDIGGAYAAQTLIALARKHKRPRFLDIAKNLEKCGEAASEPLLEVLRTATLGQEVGRDLLETAARVLHKLGTKLPDNSIVRVRYYMHQNTHDAETITALIQEAKKHADIRNILATDYLDSLDADTALQVLAEVGDSRALKPIIERYNTRKKQHFDTTLFVGLLQKLDPEPRTLTQRLRGQRAWADEYQT